MQSIAQNTVTQKLQIIQIELQLIFNNDRLIQECPNHNFLINFRRIGPKFRNKSYVVFFPKFKIATYFIFVLSCFTYQIYLYKLIIIGIINEVTAKRSSLATGKMTENEAKDYRQKIVSKADFLNQLLKLDLVVRDSNGHILPPGR